MDKKKINIIACSIFQNEIDSLINDGDWDFDVKYISSMLHMSPSKLDDILLQKFDKNPENLLLIYGDCSPTLGNIESYDNISRTQGRNCIEIMLGEKRFRELQEEKVFFLMPEWAERWEEVFKDQLHLEGDVAKEFMNEFHSKIVLLDTGYKKIPDKILKDIEEYTDLKIETVRITTDELKKSILQAMDDIQSNKGNQ